MAFAFPEPQNLCWMRQLEVRLYSELARTPIVFGGDRTDQLEISVKGAKHLSALKDKGSCIITNLTYSQIVEIILGQYKNIEIWAGYRSLKQLQCFFKGSVSFISDEIRSRREHSCHILFASKMVASYSQARMNLSLNSGINLYSAFNYLCLTNGISPNHLPQSLKREFLSEVTNSYNTPASLAEQLAANTSTFTLDTDDSIDGAGVINCSDLSDKRVIKLNANSISFRNGNPSLDKDGLKISLIPTLCFKPGDIIIVDNSIIDVHLSNAENVSSTFKSNYLDPHGAYMIIELDYHFENRATTFEINAKARSLSIISNITGANA